MSDLRPDAVVVPVGIKRLNGVFCGCGNPEMAWGEVRLHLTSRREADYGQRFDGKDYIIAYLLDHYGLTEHGGNVGGAWLTDEGVDALEFLEKYGDSWDDMGFQGVL